MTRAGPLPVSVFALIKRTARRNLFALCTRLLNSQTKHDAVLATQAAIKASRSTTKPAVSKHTATVQEVVEVEKIVREMVTPPEVTEELASLRAKLAAFEQRPAQPQVIHTTTKEFVTPPSVVLELAALREQLASQPPQRPAEVVTVEVIPPAVSSELAALREELASLKARPAPQAVEIEKVVERVVVEHQVPEALSAELASLRMEVAQLTTSLEVVKAVPVPTLYKVNHFKGLKYVGHSASAIAGFPKETFLTDAYGGLPADSKIDLTVKPSYFDLTLRKVDGSVPPITILRVSRKTSLVGSSAPLPAVYAKWGVIFISRVVEVSSALLVQL